MLQTTGSGISLLAKSFPEPSEGWQVIVEFLLLVSSVLLSLASCVCLVFSQRKHALAVFGRNAELPAASACRRWAWGLLFLCLACLLGAEGGDFVLILWPMIFGASALLVALMIAFFPTRLRSLRILPGMQ